MKITVVNIGWSRGGGSCSKKSNEALKNGTLSPESVVKTDTNSFFEPRDSRKTNDYLERQTVYCCVLYYSMENTDEYMWNKI